MKDEHDAALQKACREATSTIRDATGLPTVVVMIVVQQTDDGDATFSLVAPKHLSAADLGTLMDRTMEETVDPLRRMRPIPN